MTPYREPPPPCPSCAERAARERALQERIDALEWDDLHRRIGAMSEVRVHSAVVALVSVLSVGVAAFLLARYVP